VESAAKLDGRNMIMVLGPEKKAKAKVESAKEAPQQEVVPSISADVTMEVSIEEN
jgi:hypothetical protein